MGFDGAKIASNSSSTKTHTHIQIRNRLQVFMTKKRTADSKFSEFKGGDLNKYTAKSYTIQNGNEIFGGWFSTFIHQVQTKAKYG